MAVNRYFSSIAAPTTLTGGISNVGVSVPVLATTGFPTSYPYTVSIDYGSSSEELVDVTGAAGLTLTVTRGVDGTSAQSHSVGAVVRHVSSGRDFADAQGHMGAVSAVHGVAGTLVGTSDTQTLANKTLTNPTITSAALSGTLSGLPTFSGAALFTGNPGFRGTGTAQVLGVRAAGDTVDRLAVAGTGKLTWGPGNAAGDVTLSRFGGGGLATNASLMTTRPTSADPASSVQVAGETFNRFQTRADGKHEWGPGAASDVDTNLYRNAVGELKTDTALTVLGALSAGNMNLGPWTANWVPTWGTGTGLHTPLYGNALTSGGYAKFGRLLLFTFGVTFGSTTNFGAGATVADNWTFALPGPAASATFAGSQAICGFGRATQTSGQTIPITVHVDASGANFQLDTSGGRQDGVAITNFGTLDSLSPWTWATGGAIQFWGFVETVS